MTWPLGLSYRPKGCIGFVNDSSCASGKGGGVGRRDAVSSLIDDVTESLCLPVRARERVFPLPLLVPRGPLLISEWDLFDFVSACLIGRTFYLHIVWTSRLQATVSRREKQVCWTMSGISGFCVLCLQLEPDMNSVLSFPGMSLYACFSLVGLRVD